VTHISRPARALLLLACLGLGAAACGSAASGSANSGSAAKGSSAAKGGSWPPSPAGTWGVEPKVVVPASAPPTKLVVENLINGTGALAKDGDELSVKYVGVSYASKAVFSQSWEPYQPFSFVLGMHEVIAGWDQGLVGMRAGGRRELIIPAALAYGAAPPAGSGIAPNASLIFIVDLLKVQPAAQG